MIQIVVSSFIIRTSFGVGFHRLTVPIREVITGVMRPATGYYGMNVRYPGVGSYPVASARSLGWRVTLRTRHPSWSCPAVVWAGGDRSPRDRHRTCADAGPSPPLGSAILCDDGWSAQGPKSQPAGRDRPPGELVPRWRIHFDREEYR